MAEGWGGGVVRGNGGSQGAAEVNAGKKTVILGERLELNRDLGSHSQKQHDTNNRPLRQGEETEKRRAHIGLSLGEHRH